MMPAMRMPPGKEVVPRYSTGERLTHWAVAVAYVALFLSGLAMFHPFFYWTSALFGSAAFMRVLHPFLGVALFVLFYAYALRLWRDNILSDSDRKWMGQMVAYMNKAAEPYVDGKYNAGQKLMYWSMIVVIAGLFLTGIVLWRPYFAPSFSLVARRFAAVIHAGLAFVMFVGIGIHVYAAYWTKGSMRAMTRGTVSGAWARFHHPGWYARMTGKERP
ncbi:formate dehydrogenase, gamma subunit [Anaeromyxobacter sp. K]|uniref:Formate dehydrogenase, gamma subunit n=1 Tax=Anaeromyxobacter dehalogenans (strain ATCC BAA-258 / DSM 21875 / 2CP-1) TaxID=455488 RepID=B8J7N9_ANAD2|nr:MULTISPECIES: formate dehydrogenase subunit gamma [Anaeromyxobacter]ACG75023.1 formate dehydrogenase, gamma subunit [Anaeromyxobacter sp. K]ACL67219.1 formate dehydrogenase, gamma subunit [Anaeromyxobacter dehalogenans 2CP-1]